MKGESVQVVTFSLVLQSAKLICSFKLNPLSANQDG